MTTIFRSCALLLALTVASPAMAGEPTATPAGEAGVVDSSVPTKAKAQRPATPSHAPTTPAPLAEVTVTVAPYGDLVVDGKLVARNVTQLSLALPVGDHQVAVHNPWSKTEERTLTVAPAGAELKVKLKPRPAELVVHTNIDADVLVDGVSVGRSWTSELAPLLAPLEGWRARRKVRLTVQRRGYRPLMAEATLVAGTRTVVQAKLSPIDGAVASAH